MFYFRDMRQNFKYMFYYSFKLGNPESREGDWMLYDIKLPSPGAKYAICLVTVQYRLKHYLDGRKYGYWRDGLVPLPDRRTVELLIKQVIEYKRLRTPEYGYTMHRYKKQRLINPHEFLEWFPDDLPEWNYKY